CHGAAVAADVASGIALAAHLWRHRATDQMAALLAGHAWKGHDHIIDTEVTTP
ncbi:phosphate acyltransferase PlsX, partial [Micromonospora azadirachtae]